MVPVQTLPRPRVTRETRRLLAAAGLALAALWILARLRFPDAPVAANPVPPLLAQLAPPARLSELAAEIGRAAVRVRPTLSVVSLNATDGRPERAALRIRPGLAAALVGMDDEAVLPVAARAVAADRATGLLVVPVQDPGTPDLSRLAPATLTAPQVLLATTVIGDGTVALAPVFIPALSEQRSPEWGAVVWRLPPAPGLSAGTFLFTAAGDLVGVVAGPDGAPTVVPAAALFQRIDALLEAPMPTANGWLGISVAAMTPALSGATGVNSGVVVTHVEANGPAADLLRPGDVITRVNGMAVATRAAWHAVAGRLQAGDAANLHVEGSGDEPRDVELHAATVPAATPLTLGLQLRRTADGAQVIAVTPGSAADLATLRAGDIVTRIGDVSRPTPAQADRAYAAAPAHSTVLVAFTRAATYHVTVLER